MVALGSQSSIITLVKRWMYYEGYKIQFIDQGYEKWMAKMKSREIVREGSDERKYEHMDCGFSNSYPHDKWHIEN